MGSDKTEVPWTPSLAGWDGNRKGLGKKVELVGSCRLILSFLSLGSLEVRFALSALCARNYICFQLNGQRRQTGTESGCVCPCPHFWQKHPCDRGLPHTCTCECSPSSRCLLRYAYESSEACNYSPPIS